MTEQRFESREGPYQVHRDIRNPALVSRVSSRLRAHGRRRRFHRPVTAREEVFTPLGFYFLYY